MRESERCRTRNGFSRLEVAVVLGVIVGLLALWIPALIRTRDAARLTQSRDNLKQFGLALHSYQDVYPVLPIGGTLLSGGREQHGWFTRLLPYIDSSPIYMKIDQRLSWNEPVNREFYEFRCAVALIPGSEQTATTEGYGLLHYPANPEVMHINSSVSLEDFASGTAHGWLIAEAVAKTLPWGSAFNWRDWNEPLNSSETAYGRPTGEGALFLMADGSVRLISNAGAAEAMRTLNGGLPPVDPEDVRKPPYEWEYDR